MGRGLSDLQRRILGLALEGQGKGQNFLRSRDLLAGIWGGELAGKYDAAHASLSRALTRLWQRRLIEIWKNLTGTATAISLTDTGAEVAQRIRVGGGD